MGINFKACPHVAEKYFLPKARVHKNDILLAVKGATIASTKSVAHVCEEVGNAIVNGSIFRMQVKDSVNPRFVALALSTEFAKKQMKLALVANNGVDYLDKALIHRLVLPVPDIAKQNALVEKYDTISKSAREMILEANSLLSSIDDYLQSELDITLPPEAKNTIAKRTFRKHSKDLYGWRFDARVHQYDFNLRSKKYLNARLATVCAINPKTVFRGLSGEDQVSFVSMDTISERLGTIDTKITRTLDENTGYTSFQNGDLLWAKITPCMENGKSAIAHDLHNGFGYGSTELHILRSPDDRLDIEYLHALLRMKRVRDAAIRFFTGSSGHQRVDAEFLKTLEIPIPPINLQRSLAVEVRNRVYKAAELETSASKRMETAKVEIETILLGDA